MNAASIESGTASESLSSPSQLLKQLQTQFAVFRDCAPLAIGIDKQILQQLPATDRKTLRVALAMHTKSTRYLKQTQRAEVRLNLDGSAAEPLLDEHRARAVQILRDRQKKMAEQHKAARVAEEAARKMTEKLGQLAQKFARAPR